MMMNAQIPDEGPKAEPKMEMPAKMPSGVSGGSANSTTMVVVKDAKEISLD